MNVTKIDCVGREWIQLAEERVHWGVIVSAVLKLPVVLLSSPITGLDRPRGFQEINVPKFRDNSTGWW